MADGALDTNGVWQYGEDDERDTFSELLNIGQESVSDAIGTDRGRLTALETKTTLTGTSTGIMTAATGWQINLQTGRKIGGLAFIEIAFQRTGADITNPAGGDITDSLMATFQAGWVPANSPAFPCVPRQGRPATYLLSAGGITLVNLVTGSGNFTTGEGVRIAGIYPLA